MSMSVENVKKVIVATAQVASAAGAVLADGQVTIGDLKHAPALLAGLKGFAGVNYRDALPELKDMDDAEKASLDAAFRAAFDIQANDIEAAVEEGLALLLVAIQAIMAFVDMSAKVKA